MGVNPSKIRSDRFVDSLSAGPAGRFADRPGSLHVGGPLPTSVMTGLPGPRVHLPDHRTSTMHRARLPFRLLLVMAMLTPVASGCGGTKGNTLPKVTGSVNVDGKPADGAVLLFYPEGGRAATATGTADASGTFTIVTNMEPGIALGRYKVTASWPDPSQRATAEDLQRGVSKDAADLLGGRYVAPDRTPLTAEVTSTTKQLPLFELSTK